MWGCAVRRASLETYWAGRLRRRSARTRRHRRRKFFASYDYQQVWGRTNVRNFSYNFSLTALIVLASFAGTFAQEHAMHSGDSENLGSIHFATSCTAQVQTDFDTGVALLHSFEYARATERFREVEKRDPACAMGYWAKRCRSTISFGIRHRRKTLPRAANSRRRRGRRRKAVR